MARKATPTEKRKRPRTKRAPVDSRSSRWRPEEPCTAEDMREAGRVTPREEEEDDPAGECL